MDTILNELLYADPAALQAYQALSGAGGRVLIVGGAPRDRFLGKTPKDIDLMVAGLEPEQITKVLKSLPGKATLAGKNFGVYHYHVDDSTVEIALPRTEKSTGTGHKDFEIKTDPHLPVEEDLARRDFTANAIAYDIDSGQFIDPFDGEGDIKQGVLRLISDRAFHDDPLRIVRALVAYSRHGLEPDMYTMDEMESNAARIRSLPGERIQMELDKLLGGSDPAGAFEIAWETGVLDYLVPELSAAMGFSQHNVHHDLDVGEHTLQVLKHISTLTDDPDLRLAALLHDLGKPDSIWFDEEENGHFYEHPDHPESADHEELGAEIASQFMRRLNYSNARISRVTQLVRNHMFPYFNSESGARKFINRLGGEPQSAYDLMLLREADSHGKSDGSIKPFDEEQIAKNRQYLDSVVQKQQAFTAKDLAINGSDLIKIGIRPGPHMGEILRSLVELVLDNPELNQKDTLLKYVKEVHSGDI